MNIYSNQNILTIAGGMFFLDMLGYMLWATSGQAPVDGFYIGAITANVLRALLF